MDETIFTKNRFEKKSNNKTKVLKAKSSKFYLNWITVKLKKYWKVDD